MGHASGSRSAAHGSGKVEEYLCVGTSFVGFRFDLRPDGGKSAVLILVLPPLVTAQCEYTQDAQKRVKALIISRKEKRRDYSFAFGVASAELSAALCGSASGSASFTLLTERTVETERKW